MINRNACRINLLLISQEKVRYTSHMYFSIFSMMRSYKERRIFRFVFSRFEDELGLNQAGRPSTPLRRLSSIVGARYTLYQLDSLLWRHNEPTISSIVDIIPVRLSRSVLCHCSPCSFRLFLSFLRPPRLMLLSPSQRGASCPGERILLATTEDYLVEWSTF